MFTKIHGPLDNFSSFQYENYLQEIKKTVKCARYPLQEISNRIKEKQNTNILTIAIMKSLMFLIKK